MGKSNGKKTFATTKEINSCENQNQTSRFESVEMKSLYKIKKYQRLTFQTSEFKQNDERQ